MAENYGIEPTLHSLELQHSKSIYNSVLKYHRKLKN
jgi:hypothetical protein